MAMTLIEVLSHWKTVKVLDAKVLDRTVSRQLLDDLGDLSPDLRKSIEDDTVTLEQVDSIKERATQASVALKGYVLFKEASRLRNQGREEEALQYYDEALELIKETSWPWASTAWASTAWPLTVWFEKVAILSNMKRFDESFQTFQEAYSLRENFEGSKRFFLTHWFGLWSNIALLRGVLGIEKQDTTELQKSVEEYLDALDKAQAEGIEDSVETLTSLVGSESLSQEDQAIMEELELAIRLLAIKNPFDRWRALTKEISKVWPKDVSAVDAIREQRDREWNR